jgi:hypothetical protein
MVLLDLYIDINEDDPGLTSIRLAFGVTVYLGRSDMTGLDMCKLCDLVSMPGQCLHVWL